MTSQELRSSSSISSPSTFLLHKIRRLDVNSCQQLLILDQFQSEFAFSLTNALYQLFIVFLGSIYINETMKVPTTIFSLLAWISVANGFCTAPKSKAVCSSESYSAPPSKPSSMSKTQLNASRRSILRDIAVAPLVTLAGAALVAPESALASGGATAGGAYLLSAKQRYNERVTKAVKGLLAAGAALAEGNSKEAKAYFSNEEAGSWKDLTAAGYLLSNAFRRNSTTAPDRYV